MFGDLEKTCSAIWRKHAQQFGENVFGDLEKTCSTIWRKRVRRFGENMFGDLKKTFLVIWRNSFGKNVGDLEKSGRRSYGDFVLEFVMEWHRAQRP